LLQFSEKALDPLQERELLIKQALFIDCTKAPVRFL
jgi:hypothetical protein